MKDLIELRNNLDRIVGHMRREKFFTYLFNGSGKRFALQQCSDLREAEYIAQQCRYADIPATVEQSPNYPSQHTVWVSLTGNQRTAI